MKNIFLVAGALCFGTVGFAQVSQTPTNGDTAPSAQVIVAQVGAATTANTGLSVQNGNDNKVQVRQAGVNQSTFTNQSDGNGTGGNLARVFQFTVPLTAPASGSAAETVQLGTANQSTTAQSGDNNEAVTHQGTNDAGSAENKALIQQASLTPIESDDNYAAITQDGDENQANTFQSFDDNDAWTIQDGNRNNSEIDQLSSPLSNSDGNEALVEQYGDDNESKVTQLANGNARNEARTLQQGDGNQAEQNQVSVFNGAPGNRASIGQGAIDGNPLSDIYDDLGDVDNVTNGSFNPDSFNGIAFQNQIGNDNEAVIGQFGSENTGGNQAEQDQEGFSNNALIVQNAFGNGNGGANFARQEQEGSDNNAGAAQNGDNQRSLQVQDGSDNISLATQRGDNNGINTFQFGNENVATVGQRGNDNRALVVQRDGQSYSVTQNLPNGTPVGTPNGNNQADILQLGPNGNFGTDGVPYGFTTPLTLTGPSGVAGFSIADF